MKTIKGKLILVAFCLVCALVAIRSAQAADATGTLTVQAVVNGTCSVSNANLNFGNIIPGANGEISTAIDQGATFQVTCSVGVPYSVDLDGGLASNGGSRAMTGPNNELMQYQLFQDPQNTIVWGSIFNGSPETGTGNGSATDFTVYGEIPAQGGPFTDGNYSDTVTIDVAF